MAGPVLRGEHRVSWASRAESPPQRRHSSGASSTKPSTNEPPSSGQDPLQTPVFFSPSEHRIVDESPLPVSPSTNRLSSSPSSPEEALNSELDIDPSTPRTCLDMPGREFLSAPAELHQHHSKLISFTPSGGQQPSLSTVPNAVISEDTKKLQPLAPKLLKKRDDSFELDRMAPIRAARERSGSAGEVTEKPESPSISGVGPSGDPGEDSSKRWDSVQLVDSTSLDPVQEEDERAPLEGDLVSKEKGKGRLADVGTPGSVMGIGAPGTAEDGGPVWGESFKVEWIRMERLPFHRTRHLRNPWNHDREVKVSRDGTELEPSVGQALLDEWDKPDPQQQSSSPVAERPQGKAPGTESTSASVTARGKGRS